MKFLQLVGEIFGFVSDVSGFFCYFSVKVFGFPGDFLGFCAKDEVKQAQRAAN